MHGRGVVLQADETGFTLEAGLLVVLGQLGEVSHHYEFAID